MREFKDRIEKELLRGLRNFHKSHRGTPSVFDLYNLKPTPFGLSPYDPVVVPVSEGVMESYGFTDESHPFPQLFVGKKYCFIACIDRIFVVSPDDWDTPIQLDTYDAETPANLKDITRGNAWEFADFWDTWFLTNGQCTVFGCWKDEMLGSTYKTYIHDGVPIQSALDHKGRVLFGGFDPSQFWNSTWDTFWDYWYDRDGKTDSGLTHTHEVEGIDVQMPIEKNFIWWSSIGGGDALMFFFPSLFASTGPVEDSGLTNPKDSFILKMLKRNEQGFAPMPFQGKVWLLRPLGDHFISYGEGGIAACTPVSTPAPTVGVKRLPCDGLCAKAAADGGDLGHVYIDNSGILTRINPDLSVEPLGYREFFYPLLGTDLKISYSENMRDLKRTGEFHISNGFQNYQLTENGLCEHGQPVTSTKYFAGATLGLGGYLEDTDKIVGRVGVDSIDFGLEGIKTIESVRVIGYETIYAGESRSIEVALDYRYQLTGEDSWTTTSYRTLNNEGIVFFPVSGIEFRLRMRNADYERLDIQGFEFAFKHGDKRYKRGVSVSETFSGANR